MMLHFQNSRAQVDPGFRSDPNKLYSIKLFDETEFVGNIIDMDSAVLVVKTQTIPRMEIPLSNVAKMVEIDPASLHHGAFWFPNPNPTRYFISTSAHSLAQGEGYYQNLLIVVNSFNFGITDHISLMAGFEWTSLMLGEPVFLLSPKVSYNFGKDVKAASGVLLIHVPENTAGIVYEVLTFGNNDNNFSAGLGWGFINKEFGKTPVINLSGMRRVAKGISLVTESWIIPSDGFQGFVTYGVRFFNRKIAVDLGFINNATIAELFPLGIPLVDFVVKFGKK